MFLLSLVRTRASEAVSEERLIRTAAPALAAKRNEAVSTAAVPEKSNRRIGWLDRFEQMMTAYAELVLRDLR